MFYLMMIFLYMIMFLFFHPLILGVSIIFQAIIISSALNFFFLISWYSYLIFIVYLGGILMIFSYMISLTSFSKITTKKTIFSSMMGLSFFFLIPLTKESFLSKFLENKKKFINLSLMSESFYILSILLMMFLLFIMIVVVFLTESSKGLMRTN